MNTARYVAAGAIALAIGVGAYLAVQDADAGKTAPSVAYTLLDGTKSSTDQLRGKVVLVNFWVTTCAVCVREMPRLVAAHEKFKARGYETLSVAMRHDPPANVVDFAQTRQLPFSVAIDNTGSIAHGFGNVTLTPTSFLINKRGQIVKRFVGEPDFAALDRLIEKLLAEA